MAVLRLAQLTRPRICRPVPAVAVKYRRVRYLLMLMALKALGIIMRVASWASKNALRYGVNKATRWERRGGRRCVSRSNAHRLTGLQ